ncbi:MAG: ribonuclease P protein component [Cyanobacteria bacterium J083]|nr:MAG: ribonuclease P protein component [Cyanobacteria bacterium J083]
MGLPKQHRLTKRQDFSLVYRQGIRHRSQHLLLRALAEKKHSPSNSPTRFGISISQKVSKKAVVRNRIKRQIRAAILELLPLVKPGWKIVIVVLPEAIECKYEHFLRELRQLLIKTKIINGY